MIVLDLYFGDFPGRGVRGGESESVQPEEETSVDLAQRSSAER